MADTATERSVQQLEPPKIGGRASYDTEPTFAERYIAPWANAVQLYSVDEDQADDPEFSGHWLLTAEEIGKRYPQFAPLFKGDGTESLTYVAELWRVRIEPLAEDGQS